MRYLLLITVLGALLPATAGARPTISPERARAAALAAENDWVQGYNDYANEWNADLAEMSEQDRESMAGGDPEGVEAELLITRVTMDDCDRETAFRALCDYTEYLSDGTTNDGTWEVIVRRNGRYAAISLTG